MLAIGTVLYGFCGGFFGRDSYSDKRVEAIGADWIIVRNTEGRPEAYFGDDIGKLAQYTTKPADED